MPHVSSLCRSLEARVPDERRRLLVLAFLSTLAWAMLAHGYGFANLTLSHDSMNEWMLDGVIRYAPGTVTDWKISLGRFAEPIYQKIFRGDLALPWLSGMLSILFLTLCVYLTARVLRIRKPLFVFLTSGVLTANLTVTAMAATYVSDLDANLFACLLAIGAVRFWQRGSWRSLFAIPCLVFALGIYQCTLSVAVTLILLEGILLLLQRESRLAVLRKGLLAVGLILAAGVLYLLLVKLSCRLYHVELADRYNGITRLFSADISALPSLLVKTYRVWFRGLFPSVSRPAFRYALAGAFFLLDALLVVRALYLRRPGVLNTLFAALLALLLPLGMNLSYFLDGGMAHHLMYYAFYLLFLLPFPLLERLLPGDARAFSEKVLRGCAVLLLIALLWNNVRVSNAAYVKKHLEREATLSTMTRVLDRIEQTEGYLPSETEVLFVGTPQNATPDALSSVARLTGLRRTSPITQEAYYDSYFRYILQYPIRLCDAERYQTLLAEYPVEEMPVFPAEGSLQWMDGALVVHMSAD